MRESPPPPPFYWNRHMSDVAGVEALKSGKVAVLLLAGGSGSRLGWVGPKGTFPITPFRKRTLFQLFADKIEAALALYQKPIHVAVLTSPDNHEETVEILQHPDWDICPQHELPYLEEDKKREMDEHGPDGNGGAFAILHDAGVLQKWKENGVGIVSIAVIENPLADPLDIKWLSFHLEGKYDLTAKFIERLSPKEKVGILVQTEEGARILEYNEAEKGMEYLYGNTALYLFSIDLAIESAKKTPLLPYHLQWKKIAQSKWGWKRERLMFDHFAWAKKFAPIIYPREETFAPLKKLEDVQAVQCSLTSKEREILECVTGRTIPATVVEIDPAFYYPTPALLEKWRGKEVSHVPYVEA